MTFHSVLFRTSAGSEQIETRQAPSFFRDLNLDQVVDAVTAEWKDYDLLPFYYTTLSDVDEIAYRQEVMRDLENDDVMQSIRQFSGRMRSMRERLNQVKELRNYQHSAHRRQLAAISVYCEAVQHLSHQLPNVHLRSRGLLGFRDYLNQYVASVSFRELSAQVDKLESDLAAIRYSLLMKDGSVTARAYEGEDDYSVAVERTFEKFRRLPIRKRRIHCNHGHFLYYRCEIPACFRRIEDWNCYRCRHARWL